MVEEPMVIGHESAGYANAAPAHLDMLSCQKSDGTRLISILLRMRTHIARQVFHYNGVFFQQFGATGRLAFVEMLWVRVKA